MALVCLAMFESWLPAAFPAIFGGYGLLFTVIAWWHVRTIDYLHVDRDGLTLVAKDGAERHVPFKPELQFAVVYEQCCRSIIVTAGDPWDREHIVADVLDVPRGLSIYGLCDLMNNLSQGRPQHGATAIRRPTDWYREPARMSRLMFLTGSLAVGVLFVCVLVFLEFLTWSLSDWVSKPIYFMIKLTLSLLFTYPAYRFLVVGRLRDLGEAATHRNALGLVWNRTAGSPLRIYLRRGTEGRNEFGPEPRI